MKPHFRTLAISVIGFVALLSIGLAFVFRDQIFFYDDQKTPFSRFPFIDFLVAAAGMLLGIIFGQLYNQLGGPGPVSLRVELRNLFTSRGFLKSMLIAPLIFSGVYAASGSQPDRVVAALFAFQNGFFCLKLFEDKYSKPP